MDVPSLQTKAAMGSCCDTLPASVVVERHLVLAHEQTLILFVQQRDGQLVVEVLHKCDWDSNRKDVLSMALSFGTPKNSTFFPANSLCLFFPSWDESSLPRPVC